MPRLATVLALGAALVLAGCVQVRNMDELKAAVGADRPEEVVPAAPPVARAMAFPGAVRVGEEVFFTAAGSGHPDGLDLAYLWTFNDGSRAVGPEARHSFLVPGQYRVELTVSDENGAWAVAGVDVDVDPLNMPPTGEVVLLDARGAVASRTTVGAPLTLRALASDPEGTAIVYAWDFGDGGLSTEPETRHAWTAPGRYTVALRVTDAEGATHRATAGVAVDVRERATGVLAASDAPASVSFPGGPGEALRASVTYDPQLGADLVLRVVDAAGAVLVESDATAATGEAGPFTEEVLVPAGDLAGAAPGTWKLVVERVAGVRVPWSAEVVLEA